MKEIVAMLCITACVISALLIGHDGAVLISGISIIAGIGGYSMGRRIERRSTSQKEDTKQGGPHDVPG